MRRLLQCLAVSILLVLPAHAQQRVDAEAEAAATPGTPQPRIYLSTDPNAGERSDRHAEQAAQAYETMPSSWLDALTLYASQLSDENFRAWRASLCASLVQFPRMFPPSPMPSSDALEQLARRDATEPIAACAPATVRTVEVNELVHRSVGGVLIAAKEQQQEAWTFVRTMFSTADALLHERADQAEQEAHRLYTAAQDDVIVEIFKSIGDDEATARAKMAAMRSRPDVAGVDVRHPSPVESSTAEQDATFDASRARDHASTADLNAVYAEQVAAEQAARRTSLWAPSTITKTPALPLPLTWAMPLSLGPAARPVVVPPTTHPLTGSGWRDVVPLDVFPLRPATSISAPILVGQDGTYLGTLSSNRYDPNSISNPYGRYGSRYSADSVNNPYGKYGSPYSPHSATNPYTTQAPKIVNPYLGRLSANPYAPDSTSNRYGPYGSPYSPSSIMNPYSPYGSLFSPSSVTNPYAISPLPPLAPLSGR